MLTLFHSYIMFSANHILLNNVNHSFAVYHLITFGY
jgi:hypothetical protein